MPEAGCAPRIEELKHRAIQWMVDPIEDGELGLDPATAADNCAVRLRSQAPRTATNRHEQRPARLSSFGGFRPCSLVFAVR
jgi:hypothetical protein